MPVQRLGHNATLASGVTVADTTSVLFSGVNLGGLRNLFFQVENAGPEALNTCILYYSANGTTWVVLDNTTLATLGAAAFGKIAVADNAAIYWRMTATVAANTSTVSVIVSGN